MSNKCLVILTPRLTKTYPQMPIFAQYMTNFSCDNKKVGLLLKSM